MIKKHIIKKSVAVVSAVTMLGSVGFSAFASELNGTKEILCKVGDNLSVGVSEATKAATAELINNRPDIQRPMEYIDRGLVAVASDNGVFVSWRWLGTESLDIKYNLYRNGVKLNSEPLSLTNYTDIDPVDGAKYSVSAIVDGVEGEKSKEVSVWTDGYYKIKLDRPEAAEVEGVSNNPGAYEPGDASVADLDGDGEYEIVIKWDAIVRDASKAGYTSICYIDAYEMDGTKLWRVSMGPNIRSGPHDTQFIVGDFDNDGAAEMACRTADGAVAGDGTVIGDANADWYTHNNGKNLDGPLYLTVFKGTDGTIIDNIDYYPQSTGTFKNGEEWDISSWGDGEGNRSERYLGGMACLDGVHTSFILSRGYYARTCIGAWHLEDGKIVEDWTFDSTEYGREHETEHSFGGQGYHSMTIADVDYDGKDEVIFGSMVLDDDGTGLYSTGMGHGDALHVGDFVPTNPGLEVFSCQEWTKADLGFYMRDARTGEVIYGMQTNTDNGRACVADIDPAYDGEEAWTSYGVLNAADGTVISTNFSMPANFAIYWDGDLGREIMDGNAVYKWVPEEASVTPIFKAAGAHSINAAKSNPCLQADIFGDWREELIMADDDKESIRIYTTDIPTSYRIPTLMHDSAYRDAIGWQNVCYNQPPHVDYALGYDTKSIPVPQISVTDKDGNVIKNPDLAKKNWSIDDLYFGETVELVPGYATALVNGAKTRVDNDNVEVKPYINSDDRTMVPIRFISEAFGADVSWDGDTRTVGIEYGNDKVALTIGDNKITKNSEDIEIDTASVIVNDRTFVPLRAIAEAIDKTVDYYNGLVYVSDLNKGLTDSEAAEVKAKIENTAAAVYVDKDLTKLEDYGNPELNLRQEILASTFLEKLEYQTPAEGEEVTVDLGTEITETNDYDLTTGVTVPAGGCITVTHNGWPGTPAVVVAFGDNQVHKFRIDYSSNGKTWQIGLADRVSTGEEGVYKKYYFGVPLYPQYVRYVSMDDFDTVVSEFVTAKVD